MSVQKCQKCDRPAKYKYTRITGGQAIDFFLCPEHAAQPPPHKLKEPLSEADLSRVLARLVKFGRQRQEQEKAAGAVADPWSDWT